ncbi:LOW QUALITY PROTEIN: dmX-like protein 2 [Bufo gargarizans]|uniref:LOW QUALITY PROTEIN: dmX-like protein 2 n=1 Tax=Bufo gargarizans TaxID=30331 RepID=UPI001CF47F09|nr:LOW QUALITY PROTEIN: dmX-like protein 2 [Bufo gargarizans]
MHLHQVLTGAVNPGDNCYSVGSVSDVPFTAYGSGCDIVILSHDFECVQIIPGAKHGNIQVSCVECSQQQGRIAASYGNTVCIFEPLATTNSYKRNSQLKYQWIRMGQFFLNSVTYNLAWDPQGNRLLTATNYLQLWAPPSSDILEEDEEDLDRDVMEDKVQPALNDWNCIWQCKTAVPVLLMKWSPDGEYFATAGKEDCLLKVWYPLTGWKSSFLPHEVQEKKGSPIDVNFSFVYLAHPRAVIGFSWRNTSRFMPRGSVCNVLLTSCQDGICRLWAETLLPEDSLLGGQIVNYDSSSSSLSNAGKRKDKIEHALETIHHLKHLRRGRRRSSVLAAHTELLPSQPSQQEAHRHISHHANSLCHFHIAASINPNTDIPSVLAGAAFNLDEGYGGFVVHWLNNKELHFTASIEIFIQHLKAIVDQQTENAEDEEDADGLLMKLDDGELEGERSLTGSPEHEEVDKDSSTKASSPGATLPLPTVLLERKIESLLAEWNKNADMLFTIHPVDGTFLLWHVNYLDEYNHGIFRQVQIAFSSRIPVAFPSGDASSLSKNIMMYACTTSSKEDASALLQQAMMASDLSVNPLNALPNGTSMAPTVLMVSKHIDGSLNQWAVTFANKSAFSSVLTVSHKFRYCGHRFHLNDLACHSVLPLLLTSSHHNVLVTPDSECNPWETEQVVDPARNLKGFPKQHFRNAATQTFHDPNAIYSELILWRVDPIGPLSYSGGVSELARINSLRTSAFCNVAWLPTLIPSYCLGTYCNSASACFVASDGTSLRLYQAVVDARKLLDELSDPESSKLIGEVFNIVSQQSTARPGCIIELDAITSKCGSRTQLLHVFQEDFILGYKQHKDEIKAKEPEVFFQPSQGYRPPPFSEKFFLVVIEKDSKNHSVLNMWHLHLKSVQACVAKPADPTPSENFLTIPGQVVVESSPETSPGTSPMTRSASIANLQTASKLILSSKLVYSQPLDIPDGVEVIRATPSAGHLSSSSIYPVCLAPYLVVTTCSDNKVRFWRCSVQTMQDLDGSEDQHSYYWKEWSLMNEGRDESSSSVSVAGKPVAVSCSYTGRLAVAYKQAIQHNGFVSKEFSMHVCLFECESTGGSEWVLEQTIHLDDLIRVGTMLDAHVSVDSNLFVYSKSDVFLNRDKHLMPNIKHLVHLDWVSKEDGSHILTVGVGSNIFMYGRLSGIVTDQTNSKDGIAVITLPLGGSIKQGIKSKWVLLRSIDLVSSVDGTPSLPVSLSWVRDGILVVGMDCEMHVYAQWKHNVKLGDADNSASEGNTEPSEQMHTISKKTSVIDGAAIVDDVFGSPTVIQDGGLFEAAHVLSPTLPQYHPTQLLELMDLGKVRRAKAILSHLVKCIAGEVAVVKDLDTGDEAAPKRHLSRTISVSGSTAKDMIITGKDGTREYTEIDSIPPLPLYALLSADQDAAYTAPEESVTKSQTSKRSFDKKTDDQYSDLFQVQNVTTDDFIGFETEKRESRSKVINLSQYGPTYFGREHASVLSSHLMHSSLPGLTRLEQMFLVALAGTVATTSTELGESRDNSYTGGDNLDECGLRYLLAMRLHTCLLTSLPPLYRLQLLHQGLSTCHFAWAFHSEAEEELINMAPAIQRGDPQWSELRAMGIGWWVRNINTLRRCIEKVAKASFQRNSDPLDAAIFYLAMKKKAVLWGLFRSQHDEKMTTFFSHNFKEDRWRKAALKNAFSLLGKQRFEQSAAFFLLAGSLKDAIEVCLEKMEDIQLALVIARLYESEFDTYSTYESLLYERVLGCQKDGTGFCCSKLHPDPFLRSIAYWIIKDYTKALDTLLEQTPKEDDEIPVLVKSCNPVVFSFYNFLRTHPLLIRRRVTVPEATLATVSSKTDKNHMDEINLIERKLFFTTANAHFKVGCPVLALEVLSKIPKLSKSMFNNEDLLSVGSVGPDSFHSIGKSHLEEGSESDWFSLAPSSAKPSMFEDSVNNFDWGSPLIKIEDEPLQLDWEENKESDTGDDDGLVLKSLNLEQKDQSLKDVSSETPTIDNSVPAGNEVDVIAEQLKFRACLKILMTELRTLATGHEVDGGKLRFQLYNWLEKEIAAMHKIFNHETESKDFTIETPPPVDMLDGHEFPDKSDIGSYERHQIERRRLQAKREHAEKRKWWLQKNQALLRVFLSYCSLHGAQGGGLASVRMELKFLLQESQQETTVKQLQSPLPLPTTLPLLSASIAVTKTVIANPVLYLNNHIHDILYTIVQMKNPPHPGNQDPKVYTLHLLAASLSASIYQALCDSHSYSSQTDANHFTGMVYQGLLLSERRRLRTESIEEHVTPNSPPATWPGVSSLINLLNTAQDEDQPKLNVLLCEAVVAVYVSLLIHALATDSSTELFRLAAHPLNNRMWAAVFGGGVKLVVKPRKPPESIPGRTKSFDLQKPQCALLLPNEEQPTAESSISNTKNLAPVIDRGQESAVCAIPALSEEIDKHRRRFNMRMLVPGRPVKDVAAPPPVPAERPTYKEKFIPPELSMWDYFVAKPFLPLSDSGVIYDSDESIPSDEDEDDEDAFLSDTQIQEHINSSSYSWTLIRLALVKLAIQNLKNFFPIAGLELTDLPVTSPLGIGVVKNLENWEQILHETMDQFGGPPPNYINTIPSELTVGTGPAILRHKAMLDPENTPFKSKDYTALPVKRLWHYLVKQELLQETFIRYIFTKKRKQSESVEDSAERFRVDSIADLQKNQVEADLGYPGGKAKIIHKESDIIMAFAINKANSNEIVLASTHDVQELDVSSLLAAQPYIWIGEEYDRESKSSDDLDFRGSTTAIHQSGVAPFHLGQIQSSSSMPWLGSGQTSTGAGILIKRNLNNVKRMASHPVHQCYLTGAQDGSVRMFEWSRPQQLICFRQAGNARVTRLYFNSQGNKCGVADGEGFLSIWQVNQTVSNPKPYLSWQCHTKTTSDFAFITSSSLIATSGQSNDNRNVCLWDTLISPSNSLVHAFNCHDNGATVLQYAPKQQLLITGGRKGYVCIFDIRQRQILHTFQAHDSAVKALAMDSSEECFVTGSAEGNMKVWKLTGYGLIHSFKNEHAKQSIFRNIGAGVMQIEVGEKKRIFSCGADGTLKMRMLPTALRTQAGIFDIL